jgi:exonuclease III
VHVRWPRGRERALTERRRGPQRVETRRLGLRVFAWNIRQGGGARLSRITDALRRHDADILVLSEYRGGASGDRLRAALETLGYGYATTLAPPPGRSGVLIAARFAFDDYGAVGGGLPEPYRMVGAEFPAFHLVGIYMPNLLAKVPYWEALIARMRETGGHALAVGDFNTCRPYLDEAGAIDRTAHYIDRIAEIGFCDLWRRRNPDLREYSWFSTRGNGFRIDHAFLSPGLVGCAGPVRYSHEERLAGISDHSPLILELRV